MKKYVSQPTEPGHMLPYCVAVYDSVKNDYVPLKGEEYSTKEEADRRAKELNKEYQQDCYETDTDTPTSPNHIPTETANHISSLQSLWSKIDARDRME